MTRCIETSRKMQQAYPEFGDATNPDSRGAANCGPPEANLGFTADRVHWNSLTFGA
jgi:hypothetical protein